MVDLPETNGTALLESEVVYVRSCFQEANRQSFHSERVVVMTANECTLFTDCNHACVFLRELSIIAVT